MFGFREFFFFRLSWKIMIRLICNINRPPSMFSWWFFGRQKKWSGNIESEWTGLNCCQARDLQGHKSLRFLLESNSCTYIRHHSIIPLNWKSVISGWWHTPLIISARTRLIYASGKGCRMNLFHRMYITQRVRCGNRMTTESKNSNSETKQ